MSKSTKIEFGNFICKFGDKDLLDFYDEIVGPTFLGKERSIKYGISTYFFKDVELINLGTIDDVEYIGLAGVFGYDTHIRRHQVRDKSTGNIKRDFKSLESCPTAKFLLILNNHRLVYCHSPDGSPKMSQFRYATERFLKAQTREHINKIYAEVKKESKAEGLAKPKKTKLQISEEIPMPNLTLNALSCSDDISLFMDRFEVLSDIEIVFTKTNSETDTEGLFVGIQDVQGKISSSKSVLKHHNKEGLNIDAAKTHVINASSQGNQFIKLAGKDSDGLGIRGNNEDFKIKIVLENISDSIGRAAKDIFLKFMDLVKSGSIVVQPQNTKVDDIISRISRSINGISDE
ncbi:MAG: hypothetical protein KBT52_01965 [Paraperlucidibaca sp.]|nr:hypothetical protein [Paraperlucidibaca sp.]MBQ0722308.1 hypothetical protein [Paraperlucidibaca sp.]